MKNEYAYNQGFERGNNGCSTSRGFFDGILDSEEDREAREEGYRDGKLAHAIRGDDAD